MHSGQNGASFSPISKSTSNILNTVGIPVTRSDGPAPPSPQSAPASYDPGASDAASSASRRSSKKERHRVKKEKSKRAQAESPLASTATLVDGGAAAAGTTGPSSSSSLAGGTTIQEYQAPEGVVFAVPVPEQLICPLHGSILCAPVVISRCGHTFCRRCVDQRLSRPGGSCECPLDRTPLANEFLFPNLAVERQLDDLPVRCRYGLRRNPESGDWEPAPNSDGGACRAVLRRADLEAHEAACPYAPARCSFCGAGLRRADLEAHESRCTQMPCPQRAAGCPFVGTRQQLEEHRRTCALEAISPFIAKYSAQQEDLRRELQAARREFEESEARQASRIRRLEERLEAQEAHTRQLLALQEDAQRQLQDLLTQLAHLRAALAAAAPAAKATLVAAAGPAVGGKAEELALAGLSEGVPGSTGTNAQYKCIGTFNGHTGPVWCLVVNAEQKVLVSGSSDQTVKVWDIATFKVKRTFHGHEGIVHAVASHGRLIFSGSSDKTIKIWSLDKPKQTELLGTVTSHENTVCALLVAGGLLFSGSYQQVRIHDLESLECVHTLTGHNHWVRAIQCSGQLLYTASYNSIKIWDIKTFECRRTVPAHHGSIYCLAFIGQQYLACATYENAVAIYRLLPDSQLEFFQELKGHSGAVYACCVSGSRLFSGSYDYTIKVWDIDTWRCIQTLVRHTSTVDALVAQQGVVFSGSADNTIKVWKI